MYDIPTENIVIAVLVVLFVTLAMGQVVVFDLNKDTKKNLRLHKVIACLGMGAAFYALFLAGIHFSGIGWCFLAGSVVVIVLAGSMIHNHMKQTGVKTGLEYKKTKARSKRTKSAEEEKSKRKATEIPSYVFEWAGGFFALFWGLVLISPLLWYFFGDERAYLDVVESYWSTFARWFEKSQ